MANTTEYNRQYYQNHKAKRAEDARRWRQNNTDKVREANHKQYLKRKKAKADGEKENQSST